MPHKPQTKRRWQKKHLGLMTQTRSIFIVIAGIVKWLRPGELMEKPEPSRLETQKRKSMLKPPFTYFLGMIESYYKSEEAWLKTVNPHLSSEPKFCLWPVHNCQHLCLPSLTENTKPECQRQQGALQTSDALIAVLSPSFRTDCVFQLRHTDMKHL